MKKYVYHSYTDDFDCDSQPIHTWDSEGLIMTEGLPELPFSDSTKEKINSIDVGEQLYDVETGQGWYGHGKSYITIIRIA